MSSGLPPANAWDANNLAARYDRYRIDLAKISEAPSEEFDHRIAGDAYGTPECFRSLPPSGPGYTLHVDFVALGRKLKALRGLLFEGDFDLAYAASSCLDIILAMRSFAMDDARWRRYIEEHHDMDLGVTRGSRNRHGEVRTPKGIVPVAPLLGETALEYAAVWFLKLANDSNQVQNKLRDYTHVLEDLANYAKSRHRCPRLHFYVVRWLLALVSRYGPEIFGPWHQAPAGLREESSIVVDAMSARVEKLLELGPMVERLLRRTDRLPQFVDAGLDRLSQEDRQVRGVAVPSAAPALAALPPNPEKTLWMFHSAGSADRKDGTGPTTEAGA
ncbi:unnamed protein product [Aphanomyces euteiches]